MRRIRLSPVLGVSLVSCSMLISGTSAAQQQGAQRRPIKTAATSHAAPAPAAFGNSDIIALVKAGFSEDLVAIRIKQASAKDFDLSTKGLLDLKAAGVSERLIAIMFSGPDPGPARTEAKPATPNGSPAAGPEAGTTAVERLDAGIYLRTSEKYVPLEPTVFSGGKTGGIITSGLTMGIKKAKWKAVVRSPRAGQRMRTAKPLFHFPFESRSAGPGSTAALFGASSPNEFVLARMTQDDDERQLIVGEFGAFGASSGTRSQDTVPTMITRIEPGIYKVTPAESLPPGEYCFFYAAGASTFVASGTGKLFDFGVEGDAR